MTDNADVMYRLLVQGVVDYAIYMLTPEGIVANWNAGAQRAKGYTSDEIVGRYFGCFYSEADQRAGVPGKGLETARTTGRFEADGWRYRKDGTAFWAHVVIDAIYDDTGVLIGFAKVTRDVTERRERDQQLLAAKDMAERYGKEMTELSTFLNVVVANIPSAVVVQDAVSRRIMLVNDQAERYVGMPRSAMVGQTGRESMPAELAENLEGLTDAAMRSDTIHRAEEMLPTAKGLRTMRSTTMVIRGPDQRRTYVMTIADDVTDEINATAQIRHMAHHDSLSGLPNRMLFRQRLSEALKENASDGRITAVLCLDMDHFKNVNDALGHQFGDELLRAMAGRLRRALRDHDTLARLGGDEFAIVLPAIKRVDDARQTARRIIEAISSPFLIDGHTVATGISVGIATAPNDGDTADQLLRYADMALYEAKRAGRGRFESFRSELDAAARHRRQVEIDLRDAIARRELQLYYQPIMRGTDGRIVGYEALMRWYHPVRGMIMPTEFIPVAEETGLIHELGVFAIHEACREAATWQGGQTVSVNLSPVQFRHGDVVAVVASALQATGLPAERLEMEITESVLLENNEANVDTLRRIKALGVSIALDDFGTGYSSLSYLRSFPFDKIKIDKSFTRDMHSSRESMAIIRAVVNMTRVLGMRTTAEGVESDSQLSKLLDEGCDLFQGYLFGRPGPVGSHVRGAPSDTSSTLNSSPADSAPQATRPAVSVADLASD